MTCYDAMHNRESDACPGKFFRSMQALKDPEEFVRIAHIETCSVILHLVDSFAIFHSAADPDPWFRSFGAVLQGVADEVAPDLTNGGRIPLDGGQVRYIDAGFRTPVHPRDPGGA